MMNALPVFQASRNIVYRNLLRSLEVSLYSGQHIARILKATLDDGIPVLNGALFEKAKPKVYRRLARQFSQLDFPRVQQDLFTVFQAFCDNAPLWFYILMEALVCKDGRQLGPVGGRIVAEVVIGILQADPDSLLNNHPAWKPTVFQEINNPPSKSRPEFPASGTTNWPMVGDNSMIKFLEYAGVYRGAFTAGNTD